MTTTGRRNWALAAPLFCALAVGVAHADAIEAQGGDRVTGVLAGPDEIAPIVVDLPAGATLKARVRRSGKATLLPTLSLRDPDRADASGLLATKTRRKGAQFDATFSDVPTSGRWIVDVGASDGEGTWVLTLRVSQAKRAIADVTVPGGGTATFPFAALAGSRATLTATNRDGAAAPQFDALRGPESAVDLGTAKLKVKGRRTQLKLAPLAATGDHAADVALTGGGAGSVAVRVTLKPPKAGRARLTHPGAEVIGSPDSLRFVTTSLPGVPLGGDYAESLTAAGGTPPYSFAVTGGALPTDLALSTNGTITGAATSAGDFDFTVSVTDSAAPPDSTAQALQISVVTGSVSATWAPLAPSGTTPQGRSSPGFVYDAQNGRMIVALGSTGSAGFPPVLGDTAALTLGASPSWSALGTGPGARWGPSLVWDGGRDRAILYGGNVDGFQTNGEVWALDCSTPTGGWTQLSPTGGPPAARLSHVAVFDSANDRMIVFGGGSGTVPGSASRNDVWELSFATSSQGVWAERSPSGAPAVREFAAGGYDPNSERMVLFGGMTLGTQYGDTWQLDLSTPGQESWAQLTPAGTGPSARDEHTAVFDSVNARLVIFGGRVGFSDTAEVHVLDLDPGNETWLETSPGTPPAARDSHAAVYDPVGRRMVVFSGFTGFPSTPFSDVWELRLP